MKFDTAARVSEVVWNMRLADQTRSENRTVLNRLYNGDPPFDDATAEQNGVQVNRNFLEGTNLLHQARGQWNNAFLKPGDYYSVNLDCGPAHKRREWSHAITKNWNRRLKRDARYTSVLRSTGANVILHGIGPVNWANRKSPIPCPLPVPSLLIPSETDIDFENLQYFAIFREYTPAQLYDLTHGPKVDPGWNMAMAMAQLRQVAEDYRKEPNSTAYQYMPERIEELIKQDKGFWGSDAVPTIDLWDFYFREAEDGTGWHRRIVLDWNDGSGISSPDFKDSGFLYDSGKRKYASKLSEILHCQFGDCSAVAPFKYHSVRSLGWMLWGVCDLQNRLRCKFTESVFEQLMWFFRTSNQNQFDRIKKAMFTHMGVIPDGVAFVTADQRFKPDAGLMEMAFAANRQIMAENASSFVQDFKGGSGDKPMTATETMARVNTVNALVSSMLGLAYTYQAFQGREIARRFCIANSPDMMVREFRRDCLREGVPVEYLNVEYWDIEPERVMGGGNKTLAIAQVNQLLSMRQFFGPESQRIVDNEAVRVFTDDDSLADRLAPIEGQQRATPSAQMAMLMTERLMRGLEVQLPKEAILDDYVTAWLADMTAILTRIMDSGGIATREDLAGLGNVASNIQQLLPIIAQDETAKERARQYGDALNQLGNIMKGLAQQLQEAEQASAQQGGNGQNAELQAKLQAELIKAQSKAKIQQDNAAAKGGQRQAAFELEESRKDRRQEADLRRQARQTEADIALETVRVMSEPTTPTNEGNATA